MSDLAAFKATFADWRTVKGRKQLQLIFEVPLEQQGHVLGVLGAPNPVDPAWCGIALLVKDQGAQAPVPNQSSPVNTREKRDFKSLPLSQQAALACDREAFRRFLNERHTKKAGWAFEIQTSDQAAGFVRKHCSVISRSDLDTSTYSGAVWTGLYGEFEDWLREPPL